MKTESVKQVLTKSKLSKKGLCDYIINVATGCLHGCRACYVPSTPIIRMRQRELRDRGVEDPTLGWGGYSFLRSDLPKKLESALKKKKAWKTTPAGKGVVMLSSGTDPYQNRETAEITRGAVEVLLRYGKRVRILTRSPLWSQHASLLNNPNVTVGMSLPGLDDRESRQLEPNAPPPSCRWRALKQFEGRKFVSMSPTIPTQTRMDLYEHMAWIADEIRPEVVFWEPINLRGKNVQLMRDAGVDWAEEIAKTPIWADNFERQWEAVTEAEAKLGICVHYWPDPRLGDRCDRFNWRTWIDRPTVEVWQ